MTVIPKLASTFCSMITEALITMHFSVTKELAPNLPLVHVKNRQISIIWFKWFWIFHNSVHIFDLGAQCASLPWLLELLLNYAHTIIAAQRRLFRKLTGHECGVPSRHCEKQRWYFPCLISALFPAKIKLTILRMVATHETGWARSTSRFIIADMGRRDTKMWIFTHQHSNLWLRVSP